jgi:putative SOS response-associated peptidase YedK
MCYYNGQKVSHVEFIRLKELEKLVMEYDFLNSSILNGFNYGKAAVLKRKEEVTDFDIVQMEWGFIPSYLKSREEVNKMRFGYTDSAGKFRPPLTTLNAIGEEMLKPGKIYRDAALKRRCLILSSGFFEWRHVFPVNKRTGQPNKTAVKYPYHIGVKDQPYFYIAGIWQPWTDKTTGEYVETLSLVTTKANPLMRQVHNSKMRMPTILDDDQAYRWLFEDLTEEQITEIGTSQFPANEMEACTVTKDFREAVEPTKRHEYEDLPALELAL